MGKQQKVINMNTEQKIEDYHGDSKHILLELQKQINELKEEIDYVRRRLI